MHHLQGMDLLDASSTPVSVPRFGTSDRNCFGSPPLALGRTQKQNARIGDARTVSVDCRLGGVLLRYLRPWLNARADFNLARRGHLRYFVNQVDMEQLVDME
jgi:hypothetical protein